MELFSRKSKNEKNNLETRDAASSKNKVAVVFIILVWLQIQLTMLKLITLPGILD